MELRAIETVYNGYRFRSRLEARWAVFFDTLGIEYQYEKEGYDLDGVWYLPDFWLPVHKIWVEVKGEEPTPQETHKAFSLAQQSKHAVCIVGEITIPGANPPPISAVCYPEAIETRTTGSLMMCWAECPICHFIDIGRRPCDCLRPLYDTLHAFSGKIKNEEGTWELEWYSRLISAITFYRMESPRLIAAYTAARQARFEHGETPRPMQVSTPPAKKEVFMPAAGTQQALAHALEETILGLMLFEPTVIEKVAELVDEVDFVGIENRALYHEIIEKSKGHLRPEHSRHLTDLANRLREEVGERERMESASRTRRNLPGASMAKQLERVKKDAVKASYRLKRLRLKETLDELIILRHEAEQFEDQEGIAAFRERSKDLLLQIETLDSKVLLHN